MSTSSYYNREAIAAAAAAGRHRTLVGGLWEEIGALQFSFMVSHGLKPSDHLLDVGCGSMRGGIQFVPFLDEGHYFGFDINRSLISSGYEKEIVRAGLASRLPPSNLISGDDFDFSGFPVKFERALGLSLFTHLTLNLIRTCLERLADVMADGGEFYATYFEVAGDAMTHLPQLHEAGGITTFGDHDPYHYRFSDLEFVARGKPWQVERIGEFAHPRSQQMALFRYLGQTSDPTG